jgi:hypothetical protein
LYVDIPLHIGSNLVSFYALPDELDIESFTSSLFGELDGIITESSASYIYDNQWIGSLQTIDPKNGYWFIMNSDNDFSFDGYPVGEDLEYMLHQGANLISFPAEGVYTLEDVIPDALNGVVYAILSEGVSALYLDGVWEGTLDAFYGGKGYWFKSYEDATFVFDKIL